MRLKPRTIYDVKPSGADVFVPSKRIVNLSRVKYFAAHGQRKLVVLLAVILPLLFLTSVGAPVTTGSTSATAGSTDVQRQALEAQLQQLESQIAGYETTISNYQKQGKSLTTEINTLNANIAKINLQIRAINISLDELNGEIKDTNSQISVTESNINAGKLSLASALQDMYENDNQNLAEILLAHPQLSDFFDNVNNLDLLQENVQVAITNLAAMETTLQNQKQELGVKLSDEATLKAYQAQQATALRSTKTDKTSLLAETKGQEAAYQKILATTQQTAAQIRNQIFQLLGGGTLTFEKAYEYAAAAQSATGVRAAFLLAVLDRESALGQNVGQCSYKTAMSPSNIPIFLQITKALGLDPNEMLVSCPNADGVYGGAMGPAQFIPSTWKLYTSAVSNITGNNPASPWSDADAFTAAALYLKDAGAATNEQKAAAEYYCGSNWNRYVCTQVYGLNVIEQADQFQQDINVLNSNSTG
ncbi:lytic murein transglycosylase [Patescibacteria group bacterium]|nr:lytic murein transglycosylase [Patescibacteria group bacterium]